jgi:thioredoxin-related protein
MRSTRPVSATLSAFAVLAIALAAPARAGDDGGAKPAAPAAAAEAGVVFEPGTPAWADVLAKAKAANKPVFVDFSTTWCGWCKRLDRDTFSQASVAAVMTAFVNVHVDAEQGEGPDLAKRFGVSGFPTLVVVDATGDEIDRIGGYLPPEAFVKEIARIQRGEDTLPAMRKQVAEHPEDLALALKLVDKLADSKAKEALALATVVEKRAAGKDRAREAKAVAAQMRLAAQDEATKDAAAKLAERLVASYGDQEAASQGAQFLLFAKMAPTGRMSTTDPEAALVYAAGLRARLKDGKFSPEVERILVSLHTMAAQQGLARAAAAAGDDAQALNEAAWAMFAMRGDMMEARGWAERAVELSKRDPMMLDTLANIHAELGALDVAITIEEEAAGKVADPAMKGAFAENVVKWKAVRDLRAATGREVVPATPLVAPTPK